MKLPLNNLPNLDKINMTYYNKLISILSNKKVTQNFTLCITNF